MPLQVTAIQTPATPAPAVPTPPATPGAATAGSTLGGAIAAADAFVDRLGAFKSDLIEGFTQRFTVLAGDRSAFGSLLGGAFGRSYDRGAAETLRQQALVGDFGWLPTLRVIDPAALPEANGAYCAAEATVFINASLQADRPLALETFIEEVGHHLDTLLNRADARGDEGEIFRRLLAGDGLSREQRRDIRREDDGGFITVDGRQIAVEFYALRNGYRCAALYERDGRMVYRMVARSVPDFVKKVPERTQTSFRSITLAFSGVREVVAAGGRTVQRVFGWAAQKTVALVSRRQ